MAILRHLQRSPVIGILVLPDLYNYIIKRDGLMTVYFDAGFIARDTASTHGRCQQVAELDVGNVFFNQRFCERTAGLEYRI